MLLTIIAILAIAVVAGAAVLAVKAAQNKRFARRFDLVVQNTGNMRSRYELQSNDPAGLMIFNFILNGAPLGSAQGAVPAPSSGSSSSAREKVDAAGNRMQAARYQSGQITQTIGGLLAEVGYLLPGALGQTLRNLSMQVRGVDNSIQRVQLQAGRATRLATIATDTADSVGRVTGAGKNKAAEPAPAQIDDRAITPYLEPGSQVQVQMLVAPLDARRARSTSFTVLSRSTDTNDAEVVMQQGVIDYANISNTRYLLLYGLIAVAALAALWVVLFGLPLWGRPATPWGW